MQKALASMLHLHALPVSRETSSMRLFKALRDWCAACPAWQALSAPMDPAWWRHSAWRAVLPTCAESRAACRAEARAAWRCVRVFKALRDWCAACPAWQALSAPMDPVWWRHSAWRAVLPTCAEARAACRAEARAAWRCVRPVALGTPSDGGQDALRGQAPGTSPDATRDFSASRASRELA